MKNNLPLVSVIIPCRNEEKFISKCLESLVSQDYPKENLEILVVDGNSQDKTREIAGGHIKKYPLIKLLENPKKFTPFGLNIGTKQSKGEIIMIAGAHAVYDKSYISKCLKYLEKYKADNVGGVLRAIPKNDTLVAKAIAIALSHPFGAGSSYYRLGSPKPKWVDTVFGGCYKKEVFDKVGLFNEKLVRSQDIDFNRRLKRVGGRILLAPDITAFYYPQSNLASFLRHNFLDGVWTTYPLKFGIRIFSLRHLIPLFFILACVIFPILLVFYFLASIFFSLRLAWRKNDPRFLFLLPIAWAFRHFGYGLGSLWGLIRPNFTRQTFKKN